MNTLAFFEFSGQEILLLIIVGLAYPLLTLYCLIDIIRSDFKDSATKLIWALVVLFIAVIGPILYLIIRGNSKVKSV